MSRASETSERWFVFVCHASEDKDLARQIATDFHNAGIETFFDEWDITAGESVRARIDEGLTASTHVLVLLTDSSLAKPWVNAEIDAAFVRKVAGQGRLIPVRYQLPIHRLPPLLAPLRSPEIVDYTSDVHALIEDIKGVSRRPAVIASAERTPAWSRAARLSPLAARVAELFVRLSTSGRASSGSRLEVVELQRLTGASDEHLIDAISELEDARLLKPRHVIGARPLGYGHVEATDLLFWLIDPVVMGWDVTKDAVRVAAEVVNDPNGSVQMFELAPRLGWSPRRLNPVLSFLIAKSLVMHSRNLDADYVTSQINMTPAMRRYLREHS
jgi:TIR domain